ncbi:MAG TPA: S8 family serine peptidase [Solirubrobacteraceae bacterium]|nr:S8 family serine peptidase [Solirubrobacteraceae bacterium]
MPQIGLVTMRARRGESLHALALRLRRRPDVVSVEVERRHRPRLVPDDPALTAPEMGSGATSGVAVQWWAARENLFSAWDVSTGEGALVAVIDTGIDLRHPDLASRIAGTINLDPRHVNGRGMADTQGHGTHVASLACATGDNGIGMVGAGYRCSLLVIKSDLSDSSVAEAIVVATDRGADAINMSFGNSSSSQPPTALVRAVAYAYRHGVTMVAAAADSPVLQQGDPANLLQPTGTGRDIGAGKGLSVTAANFSDERAPFAGRGSQISMAAYGSFSSARGGPRGIFGAFPAQLAGLETGSAGGPCFCRTTFAGDNRYAYVQGTSMAAPQVAAIAALAHHVNPDLSAGDVIRILKRTARRPPGTAWGPELGWGILDGGAALNAARALDRTRPVSRLQVPRRVGNRQIALRWTGSDASPRGVASSGVAAYEVWRQVGDGPARRITSTTATQTTVAATPGERYRFFTIAVDRAGNRERPPKVTSP